MISRRRFLAISAAGGMAYAAPAAAGTLWKGRAFGSRVSIDLGRDDKDNQAALDAVLDTIRRLESEFSLYDPSSPLSRLNRTGSLQMSGEFARLINFVAQMHHQTDGLFDPTIQPLFASMLKSGGDIDSAWPVVAQIIGWQFVQRNGQQLSFQKPGMALTLNGIAQGFATDRVVEVLNAHGFENILVNMGEYRSGTDISPIQVHDDTGQTLAEIPLQRAAAATTWTSGFSFENGLGHVLHPRKPMNVPVWKTVCVVADLAAVADGFSTALVLAKDSKLAQRLIAEGIIKGALLQDIDGNVERFGVFV